MAQDVDDLLHEYDDLTRDAAASKYQFFAANLERWFDFLDQSPEIAGVIRQLEASIDFDIWRADSLSPRKSMGLGEISWPRDQQQRLGAQIWLFRSFANKIEDAVQFAHEYVSAETNLNDNIADLVDQIFDPFVRDLRRYLQRNAGGEPAAPASDRLVALDHNSSAYTDALSKLDCAREAMEGVNDYPDELDREQRLAEISAGRILLGARRVSIEAITATLARCLKYLAQKFADHALGYIFTAAITALVTLLGLAL